jgi:ABC-type nitrate/sulfonate/bicarbonate transport system permease component
MRLSAPEASRPRVTVLYPAALARGAGTARLAWRLAVLAAALAVWQGLSASGLISSSEFPSMTSAVRELWDQLDSSELWSAVASTLEAWAVGMLIGSVAAVAVGSLLGLSPFAYRSAIPVIEFFKTIPVVAIVPIALTLYGPTLKERYLLVAFAVFWPLVIQVVYGVRSVEPTALDTATALGVRRLRRFFVVIMPSAAPFIATGLRIAAATALIIDIVAELIGGGAVTGAGGGSGVGVQILNLYDAGSTALPIMYAYIVVAGLLGVALAGGFAIAERRVLHWHESQRDFQAGGHAL